MVPRGGVIPKLIDFIYPLGSVIQSTNKLFDPNVIYKHQTWERFAKGRTLVGVDEDDADFAAAEMTGGEKVHKLTTAEMPSHYHEMAYSTNWDGVKSSGWVVGTNSGSRVDKTSNAGGSSAHNNMQPYVTVYYWHRTA